VEKHGGSVRATSAGPGKGSEFIVSLPLSGAPSQESELPEFPACDTTSLRLLIVEDDADARDMLRMLLETYGYRVATVSDGLSAVRAIETEQPDVAFVDIGLPELDGYGVARRIRKTEATKETYLVALTGYGQPADRRKSRDAGFDNHLTKPVKMDDLLEILTKVAQERMSASLDRADSTG
jgi:two-component system CheB/CheR fusion protein